MAQGMKISILSSGKGKDFPTREDLETLVRKHGGQVHTTPGYATNFCVAHTEVPMVISVKKLRSHTIVSVPWFLRAFPEDEKVEKLPELNFKDVLCLKRFKNLKWDANKIPIIPQDCKFNFILYFF